jgi:putative endonuclease
MRQHMEGKGASYTKNHKFNKLVFLEKFNTRSLAMRREREIKKMNRLKKIRLIESDKEFTFLLMDEFYDFLAR